MVLESVVIYNEVNRYFSQKCKILQEDEQSDSEERLGELSGLSTHYISDIEQGKYSPSIPTIENIAKALDVDPYLLFIANPKANKLEPRVDIHRKK